LALGELLADCFLRGFKASPGMCVFMQLELIFRDPPRSTSNRCYRSSL
jgi:hypothetical protein